MSRAGNETVRSRGLGISLGIDDSQVRRDLNALDITGRPGVGYPVSELSLRIRQVLGTDRSWGVVLIGIGHLGQALLGYRGFSQQGFHLLAAFEVDRKKIGSKILGLTVLPLERLESTLLKLDVQLAIIAVPAPEAQAVVDRLYRAGIVGVLNFAPVSLHPTGARHSIVNVDLAMELQRLAFDVVIRNDSEK
jgi:redox-sensing transcriptional repressor